MKRQDKDVETVRVLGTTSGATGGLPARDFYAEAKIILSLKLNSGLVPDLRHLEALNEHYQCELLRLVHEIDQVTEAVLRRN